MGIEQDGEFNVGRFSEFLIAGVQLAIFVCFVLIVSAWLIVGIAAGFGILAYFLTYLILFAIGV